MEVCSKGVESAELDWAMKLQAGRQKKSRQGKGSGLLYTVKSVKIALEVRGAAPQCIQARRRHWRT